VVEDVLSDDPRCEPLDDRADPRRTEIKRRRPSSAASWRRPTGDLASCDDAA
jgi:hypothetical protein